MEAKQEKSSVAPVVRRYIIGDMTYIVKATVKEGATEDAVSKVRRLIRNEVKKQGEKNNL